MSVEEGNEIECPDVCREHVTKSIVIGLIGGFVILAIVNALIWYIFIQRKKQVAERKRRAITIPNMELRTNIPSEPRGPRGPRGDSARTAAPVISPPIRDVGEPKTNKESSKVTNSAKAQMFRGMSSKRKKKAEAVTREVKQKTTTLNGSGTGVGKSHGAGGISNAAYVGDVGGHRPSFQIGDDLEGSSSFDSSGDETYEEIDRPRTSHKPTTEL